MTMQEAMKIIDDKMRNNEKFAESVRMLMMVNNDLLINEQKVLSLAMLAQKN